MSAFVGLASTHMAVVRAALPRLDEQGAYTVVVGDSATWPVPQSGLVSMEQAALLMMQRVAAAENGAARRVFSLVLGAVNSRDGQGSIDTADVGRVAVAISASRAPSDSIGLHSAEEANAALLALHACAASRSS